MSEDSDFSRRSVIRAGIFGIAAAVATRTALAEDLDEQPKLDRKVTHYQYVPNADGSHCSICSNFRAPSSCRVIEGVISPNGYCLAFAPMDQ